MCYVLDRASAAELAWHLTEGLDQPVIHTFLHGLPTPSRAAVRYRTEQDFEYLGRDMKQHRQLTLQLLREDCPGQEPGGYGHSRFCDLCHQWRKKLNLVMR